MTERKQVSSAHWTQKQAVILSLVCLAAGIAGGWLIHWPQKSDAAVAAKAATLSSALNTQPGIAASNPSQLKSMADAQAAPLLDQLKAEPNNLSLLINVANLYYDAKQYPTAVDFYARALKVHPADASVRTDMATGYWYMGDADHAILEFNQALSYAPNSPNTLFNRGLVKWQGKRDAAGALADWQQLLAANPDYQAKAQVEQMIAQVQNQTAAGKR
jgi:tetratricopeptide (TPR) repeat protein